jgi:hypothetical protein
MLRPSLRSVKPTPREIPGATTARRVYGRRVHGPQRSSSKQGGVDWAQASVSGMGDAHYVHEKRR